MKLRRAALAAACLLSAHSAWAGHYVFTDQGTGLTAHGIVPTPGQGFSPFWGGGAISWSDSLETTSDVWSGNVNDPVEHADLLNGGTRTDLMPTGYSFAGTTNVEVFNNNSLVAGYAGTSVGGPTHAGLWTVPLVGGSPAFTDLHPAGYVSSLAQGLAGEYQVGWGRDGSQLLHPLMWQSTAASVSQLPLPTGMIQAAAAAIGRYIVGYGTGSDGISHPLWWVFGKHGTITAYDLLPSNGTTGVAVATSNYQLAGSLQTTSTNGEWHAELFTGCPAECIDLHPGTIGKTSYIASSIYSMSSNGSSKYYFAGLAVVNNRKRTGHAMVWRWTNKNAPAPTPVDLQGTLGSGFTASVATGVDGSGNVTGGALATSGVWHQALWTYEN